MLARVVDFSARNQVLVILLTAALALYGWWSMARVPLDALPELGETQVIVYTRWDRSPQIVEDQVTYPIVSALLGAPGVTSVRGYSDFGYSFVYVVFDDAHDLYWARARTTEYLAGVQGKLPPDAKPELGPDASGLGWIFQYVLQDDSGQQSLADLRSLQDWYLRYQLKSVPGVSEVASLGGFSKQFQVTLDPNRLRAFGVTVRRVVEAVRGGNVESSGRLLEFGGTEYMVRGRGYAKSIEDLESIVLLATEGGTPVRIRDVGQVVIGPDQRRGVSDLDGAGEAVSGIVVMRQGANARQVIDAVKAKLRQIEPGLPPGVRVVPVYDRSGFIDRVVAANARTILEVMLTVMVVILIFLRHWPSALIPAITIPAVVLIAFIPFQALGVTANVMSLGGIAIAIGALVDASIVVVEQAHKKLEQWDALGRPGSQSAVILSAVQEVAGTSFFALLIIAAAFLPVLVLENQEGRLFTPLAIAKTLCMLIAAGLAVTLDPALRLLLARFSIGTIRKEESHPLSRWLIRTYEPAVWWALAHRKAVFSIAAGLLAVTVPAFLSLNSEFLPPLDEGTLLYMPSTMPGISIAQAQQLLQTTDGVLKQFPEVEHVLGKAGRAETATDPAPLSMLETLVTLRPRQQWRKVNTWYSAWSPEWLKPVFRRITSDSMPVEQLVAEMNGTSYADSGLAAGLYYYKITAQDANGNVSAPSGQGSASVTADVTGPTVSLTAPTVGTSVSGTVTVSANASDDVAVASVQFLLDGAPLLAEDTSAPYSISWSTLATSNGVHQLAARARDTGGNLTTTANTSITVANSSLTGAVALYAFEETGGVTTVTDGSGNANTGSIAGATRVLGKYGNGLFFNGANAMVSVPNSSSLNVTTGLTLMAWLNPSSLGAWKTAIMKEMPGDENWALYSSDSADHPRTGLRAGGNQYAISAPSPLPLNTWTHVAVSYNGSAFNIYVNGTLVNTLPVTGAVTTSTSPLRIGCNAIWGGEFFHGIIDEVRVYNRGLTQAEIQSSMNNAIVP